MLGEAEVLDEEEGVPDLTAPSTLARWGRAQVGGRGGKWFTGESINQSIINESA
jgi:hypothetical protein